MFTPQISDSTSNLFSPYNGLCPGSFLITLMRGLISSCFQQHVTCRVPQSRALSVCIINSYSTLLNWPIVSLLVLFISFSNVFFILVRDYTLCFTGSLCCSVSYYNYISVSPYYMAVRDVWSLKSDTCNFRRVEILQYFDTQSMAYSDLPCLPGRRQRRTFKCLMTGSLQIMALQVYSYYVHVTYTIE